MSRIFTALSALLLIGLLCACVLELWSYLAFRGALGLAREGPAAGAYYDQERHSRPLEMLPAQMQSLKAARSASKRFFAWPASHAHLAGLAGESAIENPNENMRVHLYCEALGALGRAIEGSTFDGRLMVRWANLRQLLADIECPQSFSGGDFKAVVTQAALNHPVDVLVKYSAGLVLLWSGEKRLAHLFFNEVLKLDSSLSAEQESFIFSLVSDATALKAIVPARFPQIESFSRYFSEHFSLIHSGVEPQPLKESLAKMQIQAVEESRESHEYAGFPLDLHLERLLGLLPYSATQSARSAVDKELSRVFTKQGQIALARYFEERSRASELRTVPAALAADTRPIKSNLYAWGETKKLFVDEFFGSIGFYLSAGQLPRWIELRAVNQAVKAGRMPFKVFFSDDNQSWTDLSGELTVKEYKFREHSLLVLNLPREYHKYWKVHYNSALRDKTWVLDMNSMFRVYGTAFGGGKADE